MHQIHSCPNIDTLERIGTAMDRIHAKWILFVFPKTLPELTQFLQNKGINQADIPQGIGVVGQTSSLGRGFKGPASFVIL
jgi:hypothetical protein